jgi:anti-sigma regulatory factor (Ser/Thr protein kinase)
LVTTTRPSAAYRRRVPQGCHGFTAHDHEVSFYDGDEGAVAVTAPYVSKGFERDEPVVVVAAEEHLRALDARLVELGWDPVARRASGQLVTHDAAATLASFMVDGHPDPTAFRASVDPVIDVAQQYGSATPRIFGEMVAVLWDDGNVGAALELEACWNELAAERPFTLLCAYPHAVLDQTSLADVGRVCGLHSDVLPPSSYHDAAPVDLDPRHEHVSWAFLPVARAVPALRRFVTEVLTGWGEESLVPDAALVTSELATNAIGHADSPFHASVTRSEGGIRIVIEDAGPGTAAQRVVSAEDSSGRGILIVEVLAERWGIDSRPDGKAIWAELVSSAGR